MAILLVSTAACSNTVALAERFTDTVAAPTGPPKSNGVGSNYIAHTNQQPAAPPVAAAPPAQQDPASLYAAFAGLGQQNAQTNAMPPAPPSLSFPQNMVPPPPPGFVLPPPPGANAQSTLPPPPSGTSDLANQVLQAMSNG